MFYPWDESSNLFLVELSHFHLYMLVGIPLLLFDESVDGLVNGGLRKTYPNPEGFKITAKDDTFLGCDEEVACLFLGFFFLTVYH
jgi:hypothetical protein